MSKLGFIALLSVLFLTACNDGNNVEAEGDACLVRARVALSKQDFNGARGEITKLRKTYPLAFNARESGILLLDSIDMAEAEVLYLQTSQQLKQLGISRESKESLNSKNSEALEKIQFYSHKLSHDRKNKKKHN